MTSQKYDTRTYLSVEEGIVKSTKSEESVLYDYQPGNCTRYLILLNFISGDAARSLGCGNEALVVSLPKLNKASVFPLSPDQVWCPEDIWHRIFNNQAGCQSCSHVIAEFLANRTGTKFQEG